jgi:hypothetical protein
MKRVPVWLKIRHINLVTMGSMLLNMFKPEIELCGPDLVLTSHLLALGELLAQVPKI